jgi:hypothetical protein
VSKDCRLAAVQPPKLSNKYDEIYEAAAILVMRNTICVLGIMPETQLLTAHSGFVLVSAPLCELEDAT